MKFAETINGYNAMGREDAEYEACYAVAERHTVGGLHCHDFYEFYIHYLCGRQRVSAAKQSVDYHAAVSDARSG